MVELVKEAKKYIPGGVNSPVRSFKAVGGNPIFIESAIGAKVTDVQGKEYVDYLGSWGALILGHARADILREVKAAIERGTSFGACTIKETELAREICSAIPSIDTVRLTSSGTEAVMGALKLAKSFTGRKKIIKFRQCYHGWSEQDYLEADFNNLDSVEELISDDIAAVIVEPVAGNFGVIPPKSGFLEGLRKLCDKYGIILVFDEVITGFRLSYGGAQELFEVKPDLTCLGKIIGGGFPIGAFGGRRDIMELVAPEGEAYQAGTLSGNPVAVTAGLATLRVLKDENIYKNLEAKTKTLCEGVKVGTTRIGSMFSFHLEDFSRFFWKMIERGIYFAPSPLEANFVSAAHSDRDIEETIRKVVG
jgi:glutamate-1-semialdehyde 2,1-aminomutase